MFPASAIGKKPTISAKTHDLKNKIFLGALTKTGADGDDHLAFFFTWPYGSFGALWIAFSGQYPLDPIVASLYRYGAT